MSKPLGYVIGTVIGTIIGSATFLFLLFHLSSDCGPEWAGEGLSFFPGVCIHLTFGALLIIISFALILVMSLIGCRFVEKRYTDIPDDNDLIIVGGVLGGLIIPFVYAILIALGLLLNSISI